MDVDVGDGGVLVILHQVDGLYDFLQLRGVLAVVGMQLHAVHGEVDEGATLLAALLLGLCRGAQVGHVGLAQTLDDVGVLLLYLVAAAKILGDDHVAVAHPVLVGHHGGIMHGLLGIVLAAHGHRVVGVVLVATAAIGDIRLASAHQYLWHQHLVAPVLVFHHGGEHQAGVGAQVQLAHVEVEVYHQVGVALLNLHVFHLDGVCRQSCVGGLRLRGRGGQEQRG